MKHAPRDPIPNAGRFSLSEKAPGPQAGDPRKKHTGEQETLPASRKHLHLIRDQKCKGECKSLFRSVPLEKTRSPSEARKAADQNSRLYVYLLTGSQRPLIPYGFPATTARMGSASSTAVQGIVFHILNLLSPPLWTKRPSAEPGRWPFFRPIHLLYIFYSIKKPRTCKPHPGCILSTFGCIPGLRPALPAHSAFLHSAFLTPPGSLPAAGRGTPESLGVRPSSRSPAAPPG